MKEKSYLEIKSIENKGKICTFRAHKLSRYKKNDEKPSDLHYITILLYIVVQ